MTYTAKSYLENGNLTRGQYGVKPVLVRVSFSDEWGEWEEDSAGTCWGAFDLDFGWIAPWPVDDVVEEESDGDNGRDATDALEPDYICIGPGDSVRVTIDDRLV